MRRTVKIKLSPSNRNAIKRTASQFREACQYAVEAGWQDDGLKVCSRKKLHKMVYDDLRELTDLQANLVVRAISRAKEAIKGCVQKLKEGFKASKPHFDSDSVAHDQRTLSVSLKEERCSISTVDGRVQADFVLPENDKKYYQKYLDGSWNITQSTVEVHEYEEGEPIYLHLGLEKENEVEEKDDPTVMGVDLGINTLAVTSTGKFYKAGQLFEERKRFEEIRCKLQQKGTRSAHLTIKQMSGGENRFARDTLHQISKDLVRKAEECGIDVIVFEDLKYIRAKMPKEKGYHVWCFDKLYQFVKYKAEEKGIKVVQIDPKNTSRKCSRCGYVEKSNRRKAVFKCKECGYELHADFNASKNIGLKYLQTRQKSVSSSGQGQLALKSGTLKPSGEYIPR